jgi:hypothetical protein
MHDADHFDPERVAALMDGTLTAAERASMEAHAADCDRCLQLMAATARTEPLPSRSRWAWPVVLRWGVPLLAGATAVALWVNVARAPHDALAPRPQAKADVHLRGEPSEVESPSRKALDEARQLEPRQTLRKDAAGAPPPAAAAPPPAGAAERDEAKARQVAQPGARQEAQLGQAAATPVPPASASAAAGDAAPPAANERAASVAAPVLSDTYAARRQPTSVLVASPDARQRWRATAGTIEHSADGGRTWAQQFMVLDTRILAGASPEPNVVWFVGTGGFVVRSGDGTGFEARSFPERVDLVSVRARTGLDADVTTADGRVFRTADGGRTWSMQETPEQAF